MLKVTAPADRAIRLATTYGAVIRIPAGESRAVQDYFAAAAAEAGCAINPMDAGAASALENTVSAEDRAAAVEQAVRDMLAGGDPADFTENGRPRKPSVQSRVEGFEVTAQEITAAYEKALSTPEAAEENEAGGGLDVQD